MAKVHKFAFTYRGFLVSIPIIVALFFRDRADVNDLSLWVIAAIVFALGLFIRIWAQQHLHFRLRMEKIFTTTGPYRLVRNPIYIGNTLICLALIITSEQLWLIPVELFVCFLVFPLVVAYEESILKPKFGDEYLQYLNTVPRWFPKLRPDVRPEINRDFLGVSIKVELYNFLLFIPMILKDMLTRG
ncbi:MAG: methyltransferase family protein [Armatimonadota bacterium]